MSDARTLAKDLVAQAEDAPTGSRLRCELLEAAARHAEASGDERLTFDVHEMFMDSAFAAGRIDRGLTAFAVCLALSDAAAGASRESSVLWRYKWVLEWAPSFADVSRAQLMGLLDDLEVRFSRRGGGQQAVAKLRASVAATLGDVDDVARFYEQWKVTPRGSLSDCPACDLDTEVLLLGVMGRDADALDRARALVGGRSRCAEVPHVTYAKGLLWLVETGEAGDAARWHRRGYALVRTLEDKLVGCVGPHLMATAVLGDVGRGLRILKETLPAAANSPLALARLHYSLGAQVLVERVARTQARVTVEVPTELGGDGVRRAWATAELAEHFASVATSLANRFDARNGNDAESRAAARFRRTVGVSLSAAQPESDG